MTVRGPVTALGHALVLGCGFLGSHIASGLARAGWRVTCVSRSFGPALSPGLSSIARIEGLAEDSALLKRVLRDVDEVIYCVGGLPPAGSERAPELDASLILTPLQGLVDALAERPGTGLTYLSSGGAVYGNPERLPVSESCAVRPIGAYAAVRLAGERVVEAAQRQGNVTRILRCANVYGRYQPLGREQGAVGVFMDRVANGRPIQIFGDGETVRDFVYVGDLVAAIDGLLRLRSSALLNVGSGTGTSVNELIRQVSLALGREALVEHLPQRPFDVDRVILDISALQRVLRFNPLPLEAGLAILARAVSAARPQPGGAEVELEPALQA